jgi:hypothetical protein
MHHNIFMSEKIIGYLLRLIGIGIILFFSIGSHNVFAQTSPYPNPVTGIGDANNDGAVNLNDVVFLLERWLTQTTLPIDQYVDGKINSLDTANVIKYINAYPPQPSPSAPTIWKPPLEVDWQWMIDHALDINDATDMGRVSMTGTTLPEPQVYDIDGFFNGHDPNCNIKDKNGYCVDGENDVVNQLHAKGKKVICYIDAGVYEDYRPDAYKFPPEVIGSTDPPWNESYWLDIRRIDILGPIMEARMKMCKDKGFDAIEPDEIDGYSNDTTFGMTYEDQINYNRFIANMAHNNLGISIGLKGDIDQVKDLVNDFDWTLNEECFQYQECDLLQPFSTAGKSVLQVEYKTAVANFCSTANANNWNSMRMPLYLDGPRQPCR